MHIGKTHSQKMFKIWKLRNSSKNYIYFRVTPLCQVWRLKILIDDEARDKRKDGVKEKLRNAVGERQFRNKSRNKSFAKTIFMETCNKT